MGKTRDELAYIGDSGLDLFSESFCIELVRCNGIVSKAMARTVGKHAKPMTERARYKKAQEMLGNVKVRAYLARLQERIEQLGVATQFQLHKFCTDVVFTPIGSIDENSPLCQEMTVTDYKDKEGNITHTKTNLKMVPKAAALAQLSKMKGWDAPTRIDVRVKGGVMMVPMFSEPEKSEDLQVEEWGKAAEISQKKLQQDV
tara:strand:- start:26581 stop:27183 length:603 start_codon:yes stop_codon:yes gene_type:complete